MDFYSVSFGLITCIIAGSFATESVKVGSDIEVKPTQSPLMGTANKVNVTLSCTGSRSDLSYYIKNRITWTYTAENSISEVLLTDGFNPVAANLFENKNPRYRLKYILGSNGFRFDIIISGVNSADNGKYRCSLLSEENKQIDSKEMKLTVVNPVESVSIEIHDRKHNVIASSSNPISMKTQEVKMAPGQYIVKCDAAGSNPEPVMNLHLNDQQPNVSVKSLLDTTSKYASYTGSFTVDSLAINADNGLQSLVCKANIPGEYFKSVEAGIALMVQIDRPTIKCSDFTASLGDKQRQVSCNVSAGETSSALKCNKLSWYLSVKEQSINAVQKWKDMSKEYDIIESSCHETSEGLKAQLKLYTVKEKMFKETFFLVYGEGNTAHRLPISLYDMAGAAD